MKWGSFAGGAAKGVAAGAGIMDAYQRTKIAGDVAKQAQEQSAQRMLWEKQAHEDKMKWNASLMDMIKGTIKPEDWWTKNGGGQLPMSGGDVQAQTPITTASSSFGASGGLASY